MNEPAAWQDYERAVMRFISALGNNAKVTHDVKVPDAETGLPRQRDVWVEWSLGGHFPVRALVSCKNVQRALNQQDIDHFHGEFLSAGAHVGIIYSKRGFGDAAIKKARALGLHCCRLFNKEAPEVPDVLRFGLAYNFRPEYRCSVEGDIAAYGIRMWREVFALSTGTGSATVADELAEAYQRLLNNTRDMWQLAKTGFSVSASVRRQDVEPLDVHLEIRFIAYRAKLEYTMVEGSYNLTTDSFIGTQSSPWVKAGGSTPGEGWEEVEEVPDEPPVPLLATYHTYNAHDLLEDCGEYPLPSTTNET